MRHEIGPDLEGSRLDKAVASLAGIGRAEARRIVDAGLATVDGVAGSGRQKVTEGQVIEFEMLDPEPLLVAEDVAFSVLFADGAMIVVDKPAGLVVHPGAGRQSGTLAAGLLHRYPEIEGVGEPGRWGIVHRLDKDTSGVMVVARTKEAHRRLSAAIRRRDVKRTYRTLVLGRAPAIRGTVDAPIGIDPSRPSKRKVMSDGKPSVTHYRVVEEWDAVSLLEVDLDTGRTHQIRVHLSAIGLPVVGDRVYGRPGPVDSPRMFLHAARLAFRHPLDDVDVEFESALPADLALVLDQLKNV